MPQRILFFIVFNVVNTTNYFTADQFDTITGTIVGSVFDGITAGVLIMIIVLAILKTRSYGTVHTLFC